MLVEYVAIGIKKVAWGSENAKNSINGGLSVIFRA